MSKNTDEISCLGLPPRKFKNMKYKLYLIWKNTNKSYELLRDFMSEIIYALIMYNSPEIFKESYNAYFNNKIKNLEYYKGIHNALKKINEFFDIINNILPNEVISGNETIINITKFKNIYCEKLYECIIIKHNICISSSSSTAD